MYEILPNIEVKVEERDAWVGPPWDRKKIKQYSYTGIVKRDVKLDDNKLKLVDDGTH